MRKAYNWLVKNWIISVFIAAVPFLCSVLQPVDILPIIVKNSLIPLSFLASTFLGIRIFADSRNKTKRDNGEKYYRDVISFENSTNNANIQNVISKLEYEGENGEAYRGEYRGCCKSFFDYARKAMTTGNEKKFLMKSFSLYLKKHLRLL